MQIQRTSAVSGIASIGGAEGPSPATFAKWASDTEASAVEANREAAQHRAAAETARKNAERLAGEMSAAFWEVWKRSFLSSWVARVRRWDQLSDARSSDENARRQARLAESRYAEAARYRERAGGA